MRANLLASDHDVAAVLDQALGFFDHHLCDLDVAHRGLVEGGQHATFKVMERRLLKAIINPAMIVTWLAGLYLVWAGHWYLSGWFHAKFLLVLILSAVHGFFARCVKDFATDGNRRSQRFYRIINEVPTLLMIGIVILVIVKPF
jgi:protoporphyrinogen IX oxidase